jgi:signal transduction histidine kinase
VADANGNVVCSAVPLPQPVNEAGQAWHQRTVATGAFSVGDYQLSRITGQPVLTFGHPLVNRDGAIEAVVAANIALEAFGQGVLAAPMPEGAVIITFDREGTVLTRVPDEPGVTGQNAADSTLFRTIQTYRQGTQNIVGIDGIARLYSFQELHGSADFDFYVAAGIPLREGFARVDATLQRSLAIMASVAIVVLALLVFYGDRMLVRPIQELSSVFRKLRGGDLSARVKVEGHRGELDRLGEEFNVLASALQQREAERKRNELFHRMLAQAGEALASTLDYRARLRALAERLVPALADWCAIHLVESNGAVNLVAAAHVRPEATAEIFDLANRHPIDLDAPLGAALVLRTGQPELTPSLASPEPNVEGELRRGLRQLGYDSRLTVPMTARGKTLGTITLVMGASGRRYSAEDVTLAQEIGARAGLAVENARLYDEAQVLNAELEKRVLTRTQLLQTSLDELRHSHAETRRLSARMQAAREEERMRIAREIHDQLGGALTGMKMDVVWLRKHLPPDHPQLLERIEAITGLIDETVKTVRRIATELRPSLLDDVGLLPAIEWLTQDFQSRTSIAATLASNVEDLALGPDSSIAIYRAVQESLTNVARHARASSVQVQIDLQQDLLAVHIRDDGQGIEAADLAQTKSLGLAGMRERVRGVGGDVEIRGRPGQGTLVTIHIPMAPAQPAADGDNSIDAS